MLQKGLGWELILLEDGRRSPFPDNPYTPFGMFVSLVGATNEAEVIAAAGPFMGIVLKLLLNVVAVVGGEARPVLCLS